MTSFNKTKKIMMASVTVAVLLPALYVAGAIPAQITSHSLSPDISVEDLSPRAEIIVKGTVVGQSTELQYRDGDLAKPMVFTNWELKPEKFLKGTSETNLIVVKTLGGEYGNITHDATSTLLEKDENVILFLSTDEESIFGDSYYIAGVSSGHYKVLDDGKVQNSDVKKNTFETDLEQRIEKSLRK